jgi:hypothetical protein
MKKRRAACREPLTAVEGSMDFQYTSTAGLLNESQVRRLRATCQYIDKIIGEVGEILNVSSWLASPCRRHMPLLTIVDIL